MGIHLQFHREFLKLIKFEVLVLRMKLLIYKNFRLQNYGAKR